MLQGSDPHTLTYIIAFAASTLLAYGVIEMILSLRRQDSKRIERRLQDDWMRATGQNPGKRDVVRDLSHEQKWAMARWLAASQRGLSFRKVCEQAAFPWPAHQVLTAIGFGVVGFLLIAIVAGVHPATTLVGVVLIMVVPIVMIVWRRNSRLTKFNNQLPEAFELLSQSLRAGHALPAGIQLVAEQMPDPLGMEFSRVHAEQDLGIPLEEALEHLAERMDRLDVRMFVTAVQIQRQTGGDLTEIMDRIGAVIRDRIRILGQVRALTAEGRLSGWILAGLPFVIFGILLSLNPNYPMRLVETDMGRSFVAVAIALQLIGMLSIRKIVNIKV